MIRLRDYQQEAKQAIIDYWSAGGGNPLVDLATGTGKSMVIGSLTRDLIETFDVRILMLTHVKELVEQNFKALMRVYPDAPAGIYSVGLGRRDVHHRITFASIQSVYRRAKALGPRHVILIDEAHLVPTNGVGMYRTLLDDLRNAVPDLRVAGFTATPYRLDSGRLDSGNGRAFDKTVYTYDIARGIEDGFLSPLVSKAGLAEIDVSEVQRRGGEFVPGSLESAADKITREAVAEMLAFGENRRSWLVFCSGVKHAMHARDALRDAGIAAEMVSGETPHGERDRIIRDYRAGRIRALTNANVLTTGFDAPNVDMVAMLRPTLSASLYVQIVGRGTRLADGKANCLILDFAGNVRRHGPVDSVTVSGRSGGKDEGKVGVDEVRAKTCPQCEALAALNARVCKECGHEWPHEEKPKHDPRAESQLGIMSSEQVAPQQLPVVNWSFRVHHKTGAPDSVCVSYLAGLNEYREWLAFEHGGYARQKACQWWNEHGGSAPFPLSAQEAINRADECGMPVTISVKPNGKYFNIVGRAFAAAKGRAA